MRFFHFLFPLFFCFSVSAQNLQLVSALGGNFTGESLSLSFSIGEVVIETFTNNELSLNQGFFQHFDFVTASYEEEFEERLVVYPNPFQNDLHILVVGAPLKGRIELIVTGALGQILHKNTIDASTLSDHILQTRGWSSGSYMLTIISDQKHLKSSYKLTKQP